VVAETRERLRSVLITTYFVPEVKLLVEKQGKINYDAYKYSQTLLKMAEREVQYGEGRGEEDIQEQVRDQGFRKAIVSLYERRCALGESRGRSSHFHFHGKLIRLFLFKPLSPLY
jgi:putative restriction endonuclease